MNRITHQTGRTLPLEIAECIIESIDDQALAPTLFSLLTVSKDMFSVAVRRLYANPIKSVRSCRYPVCALHRLLALIAQICPEVDQALLQNTLFATSLFLPPTTVMSSLPAHMIATDGPPPYADYFSFVRVIDYDHDLGEEIQQAFRKWKERRRYMKPSESDAAPRSHEQLDTINGATSCIHVFEPSELLPIFWMACGTSHLGKVRQVSIHLQQLPEYGHMLEHMTSVEAIDCHFDEPYGVFPHLLNYVIKAVSRLAEIRKWQVREQRVEQQAHGQADLLQGCSRRRPIHFQLYAPYQKNEWYNASYRQPLRELFTLLNGNATVRLANIHVDYLSAGCDPNWVRFSVMPESIELAEVQSICQVLPGQNGRLVPPWPEGGMDAILQQCRGLRHLQVCVPDGVDKGEDPAHFAWAREERQQMLPNASRSRGCSQKKISTCPAVTPLSYSQGLVQLETLYLKERWAWEKPYQSVHNALYAFGPTLQRIQLEFIGMEIDLAWFQEFPALRELEIYSRTVLCSTRSLGEACSSSWFPCLESIALRECDNCDDADSDGDGDSDGDDGDDGETVKEMEPLEWPHMQRLRRIVLHGTVMSRVSQAVLAAHGSQLQELSMTLYSPFDVPGDSTFVWDQEYWWQLTNLQVLQLHGTMARAFRSSILVACPNLQRLELDAKWNVTSIPQGKRLEKCFDNVYCHMGGDEEEKADEGREAQAVGETEFRVNRQTLNVRQLILTGWLMWPEVDEILQVMFPALERLEIIDCHSDTITISDERLETIRALFPSLKDFVCRGSDNVRLH